MSEIFGMKKCIFSLCIYSGFAIIILFSRSGLQLQYGFVLASSSDGIRCAGFNAVRLETTVSDSAGNSVTTSAVGGGLVGGDTRYYQLWYRDNTGVCGNSHNLTNGLAITWDV